MISFTISNQKLVLSPEMLMIKEFEDIIKYAKGRGKKKGLGMGLLLYVFYCCDLTNANPMKDIDYREKPHQAMVRALGPLDKKSFTAKEEELVGAAIDAYNYFNESPLERSAMAQQKKIDEISDLLDKTKPFIEKIYDPETGVLVKTVSNQSDLKGFADQLERLAAGMVRAKEAAAKMENIGRVRGGKGSSMIERGVFRDDYGK